MVWIHVFKLSFSYATRDLNCAWIHNSGRIQRTQQDRLLFKWLVFSFTISIAELLDNLGDNFAQNLISKYKSVVALFHPRITTDLICSLEINTKVLSDNNSVIEGRNWLIENIVRHLWDTYREECLTPSFYEGSNWGELYLKNLSKISTSYLHNFLLMIRYNINSLWKQNSGVPE